MSEAHLYRKTYVLKLIDNLNIAYISRQALCKQYNKKKSSLNVATYIISGLTITLATCSAGVLFTIVGAPLAGGLAIATSICGAASIITTVISKKTNIKIKRHYAILDLTNQTITKINQLVSNALDDDTITDYEMKSVIDVYTNYRDKLSMLRNNSMVKEDSIKID
jgi:hypothetical protein